MQSPPPALPTAHRGRPSRRLLTYLPTYLRTYLLTYLPTYLPTDLLTCRQLIEDARVENFLMVAVAISSALLVS